MKIFLGTVITLFFSISAIAQSDKGVIRIVQKLYDDTLQVNYHKVEFLIDKKADRVKRMDYSSAHNSDTLIIKETTEYKYENGHFIFVDDKNQKEKNTKTYKIGDTIFEENNNYLTKKVYSKNKIIYAARLFPEEQVIPYNELKYIYNSKGNLIEIEEKYNSDEANEEYKTIFDYNVGIVTRMTEYKLVKEEWKKEKVWAYDLLTKNKIRKRTKMRINILLLYNQFLKTHW